MAAKLGYEAIQYILTKVLTKKGVEGIATIPGKAYNMRMKQLVDEMAKKMKALGYDINKVKEKDVQGLLDSAEALAKQKKPTIESLLKGEKYTDERGRVWDFKGEGEKYDDITKKMWKDRPFPGWKPKIVPKETEAEILARMKRQNKEAAERLRKKKLDEEPDDLASGGIARTGYFAGLIAKGAAKAGMGKFTKSEVLIQMLENTLKGSKDSYVKKTFPNFIKELQKNPELALDANVWGHFTKGLPKNQRLVVHSDDTVDFFRQTEFGPHNIENVTAFQKKHPFLTREQATKITKMEPEDQVLEVTRQEALANKSRTKQASGGIAGQLHLNQGGRVSFTKGGKVSSGLAHVLGV